MKIGVYGGSFNPVHYGHLIAASEAKLLAKLDEVWFVPCAVHPFGKKMISFEHRVAMLKLALRPYTHFKLITVERRLAKRYGKNYSIDTMRYLASTYQEHALYFIIGSKLLPQLPRWKGYDMLKKEVRFVVVPINNKAHLEGEAARVFSELNAIYLKNATTTSISASLVRKRLASGLEVAHLLPEKVLRYIRRHALYGCKVV